MMQSINNNFSFKLDGSYLSFILHECYQYQVCNANGRFKCSTVSSKFSLLFFKGLQSLGAHAHHFLVPIYVWLHGLHITHSFSLPINLQLILEYQGIRSPYIGNCALHLQINMPFLPQYLKKMNFGAHYLFLSYGVSRKTFGKIATTLMGLLSSRLPFHTNIVRLLMPLLVSILCQTQMAPFYY
jgi:hypothetical protein